MFYPRPGSLRLRALWRRCATFGEPPGPPPAPRTTGIEALDAAMNGGLTLGRIALLQGGPGGGKTQLCLALAARAQAMGHRLAWLDLDRTFCAGSARAAGLHADTLVLPCEGPQQALDAARALATGRHATFMVLDAWPPAPARDPPYRQLRPLARSVAEAGAVMLVAQGCAGSGLMAYDAMRYASATVMRIEARRPGPGGLTGMRLAVTKQPGLVLRQNFSIATFDIASKSGFNLTAAR